VSRFFIESWIENMDENKLTIKDLTEKMHELVKSKGWYEKDSKRPQTPRNLAISLSLEAAEILEHFQFREGPHNGIWKNSKRLKVESWETRDI
jgi:hypothetical protein